MTTNNHIITTTVSTMEVNVADIIPMLSTTWKPDILGMITSLYDNTELYRYMYSIYDLYFQVKKLRLKEVKKLSKAPKSVEGRTGI